MTTVLEETSLSEPSPNGSWDNLAPATPITDLPTADDKEDIPTKPEPGMCATCGDPIVREPGARGRMPKYHPDCRPLKSAGGATVSRGRANKAEAEADQAIAAFKSMVVKAAIMLSMLDRYDAFCIMVALPQVCENLRGVLVRYESFRKEMLAISSGGSVFGLIVAVLMMVLPMAAHHGLLPSKKVAQVLVNAPFTLHKIQQKLAEGEASLTKLMEEQLTAVNNAAKATANGAV